MLPKSLQQLSNLELTQTLQIPYAVGGNHEVRNIKKFCRQHNFQATVQDFGHEKMSAYRCRVTWA